MRTIATPLFTHFSDIKILRKILSILLLGLISAGSSLSQSFQNGDLNGVVSGASSLPFNWLSVPFSDVNCNATAPVRATPDLTDATWGLATGTGGISYSGTTHITGLYAYNADRSHMWHEGIEQTVYGLSVGCDYEIGFYQAVVRQITLGEDTSGGWAVYGDNNLLGITASSVSQLAPTDVNLIWEKRTVIFTATLPSLTFKFLPADDDTSFDWYSSSGGLRMAIDSIYIEPITVVSDTNILGNDSIYCSGSILLDATYPGATYQWQDSSTSSTFNVTSPGVYWVEITTGCSSLFDTITFTSGTPPSLQLNDTSLCSGDTVMFDISMPNASYLWSDGDTLPIKNFFDAGNYWAQVTTGCGQASDSLNIEEKIIEPINFNDDEELCEGDYISLTTQKSYLTYLWSNGWTSSEILVTQPGEYWLTVFDGCDYDSDTITIKEGDCSCYYYVPNSFSPNGDGINDGFYPEIACEITEFSFVIYDRWGQVIYTFKDQNDKWLPTIAKSDVYVWKLMFKKENSTQPTEVIGHVNVIW